MFYIIAFRYEDLVVEDDTTFLSVSSFASWDQDLVSTMTKIWGKSVKWFMNHDLTLHLNGDTEITSFLI